MRFPKLAYIFVVIISISSCFYIGSSGTFELKVPGFVLTNMFEHLWIRVTEGLYDIPTDVAQWESMYINGKAYVYYGFFPAIMRGLGFIFLDNSWFGKMGFFSCLIACFVITSFSFLIVFESLRFWSFEKKYLKTISISLISISLVVGGPVFGCILRPNLYEELILWGYAFSTVGIYGFIRFLDDEDSNLGLILLSLAASGAIVSRATFGGPLYLLTGITFIILVFNKKINETKISCFSLSLMGLLFQLWYNYVRFGNPLTFVPTDADDPYYQHIVKHGGIVNPNRIKDLFLYYFVPIRPLDFVTSKFPFFHSVYYSLPKNQDFLDYYCRVSPMLVMMPYLSFFYLGAVISFIRAFFRRNYRLIFRMSVFTIPFLLETLMILGFNACQERYKPELLPLVLVCMFFCFRELKSYKFLVLILTLCILSIIFYFEWAFGYGVSKV